MLKKMIEKKFMERRIIFICFIFCHQTINSKLLVPSVYKLKKMADEDQESVVKKEEDQSRSPPPNCPVVFFSMKS